MMPTGIVSQVRGHIHDGVRRRYNREHDRLRLFAEVSVALASTYNRLVIELMAASRARVSGPAARPLNR
ncbi:hypothetical protein Val02_02570 [Virgisporangium aliadipatigenens]|uniref:Uncharacterized protein n=1 Tax=Virgisporangium aliadipatigenens TaxID=741659 RepID=A0A8J3YG55_9ACTN|nr:hypothetical protein Val02_02570 [Virgisporangium aliadipatigenens]